MREARDETWGRPHILAMLHEPGEKLVEILLGVLHERIAGVAWQRERFAHYVVQPLRFDVGKQISSPENEGEAQYSVEGCDIERLLSIEKLLRCQIMFPFRHARFPHE